MERMTPGAAARRAPIRYFGLLISFGLALATFHGRAEASDPVTPSVSAGSRHSCVVRSDGTLACWGNNDSGEANPPAGIFSAVSAGDSHSCGVRDDGTLACWGSSGYGQSSPPTGSFSAVSSGWNTSCGIRIDGTLACWGYDGWGQASPPAGSFTAVSAGYNHTCGVRSDGTLACWGYNGFGESSPPAGNFIAVSAGGYHSCGVRSDGTLACWGYGSFGQSNPPAGSFSTVGAGFFFSCGLHSDGSVACWGYDTSGQASPPAGNFGAISAGYNHTCGVRSDGTLACWGDHHFGQAPQPAVLPLTLPTGTTSAAYSESLVLVDTAVSVAVHYTPPTPGFALVTDVLPPGLILSADGALSGTPTAAGSFDFTIEGEDANGFAAQRSYALEIQAPSDNTPPVITPLVTGTLGANGWYTSNISISWSVTDDGSPITFTSGCAGAVLNTDSSGAGFTCNATSAGGTGSASVTVKRDATAPTLSPAVTPTVILLNGSGTAAANASDALSGVATQGCSALDTSTIGSHLSDCTATDNAGNTANAGASYSVIYGFIGFSSPVDNVPVVNVATAGQTIPIKWRLVNASGTPVTDLASATISATQVGCTSGAASDSIEEYASAATALQNLGGGYYQFNWKTPKTYADTCRQLVLDLGDGGTRIALFRFK